jgi:hypothetical protein
MSRNYLDLLEMSERETTRRLNESTSAVERFEANIELENISIMRSFFFKGAQI